MMNEKHIIENGDFRLRGIPRMVHRRLKAFAAYQGISLNDYILKILAAHVVEKKMKFEEEEW